jgi:hypothetical protein
VQVNVAVNDPVPLVGDTPVQFNPEDAVVVSATVPVNPLTAVIVTVHVIEEPTVVVCGVQLIAAVKSVKLNVAVVEWDRDPDVPVMVRT